MKKSDIWFYSGIGLVSAGCALIHFGLWLILLSIICFIAAYNNFKKENPEEKKEKDIYKDLYVMEQKLDFLNNKISYLGQDLKKHKETTAAPNIKFNEKQGVWNTTDVIDAEDFVNFLDGKMFIKFCNKKKK